MPYRITILLLSAAAGSVFAAPLGAQTPVEASAEFVGLEGESHGAATLTQAPIGVVIRVELTGVPEGTMGLHIHEAGVCEAPFESAGAHFNPSDTPHGFLVESGPHAGDLPNVHVPASGEAVVEMFSTLVTLQEGDENSLLDDDGSALVLHAGPDDYSTDPSGQSGDRLACAVVTRAGG